MPLTDDQIKAFLDAAPDAMVIVDAAGRIAFVNVEAEAMFQYSRAELAGRPVDMLLPDRYREHHQDHMAEYFLAPRRRPMGAGLDLLGRRKDGTEFPVEIALSPVMTDRGRYVSSAIRDVSHRKVFEHKLIEAREVAERANRAKSEFLAAASHDLRQPLQTLTLLSQVLNRMVPTESKAAAAVASQSAALHLMSDLLNSLLDISKLEAGAIKPDIGDVAISEIFGRLRAEFTSLAEAKGLEFHIEDCKAVVRTDPVLLAQIIQNLIGNAIRYTQQGWVKLRSFAMSEIVRIEVLDTGVGIPNEALAHIFEEFYQVGDSRGGAHREGVGLGLSISRRIAGLLGCALEATSTPGRGSCFALSVPVAESRESHASRAAIREDGTVAQSGLVLVVDDDRGVADATVMLLASAGCDCVSAASADAAIEVLKGREHSLRLLISDYHLGDRENGFDVIRKVRALTDDHVPAILVSGDTSSVPARAVQGLDACTLLSKPVDPEALLELSLRLLKS